jgi:hypothetical protein
MIYDGGRWRGYANAEADLVGLLIDDYQGLDSDRRAEARVRYAFDVHVPLQADLAEPAALGMCTPEQRAVILGPRDTPPAVDDWDAPVPLVLVTTFYAPDGARPRPRGDAESVIWIDPGTDETLLASLAAAGWLTVARRTGADGEESRGRM